MSADNDRSRSEGGTSSEEDRPAGDVDSAPLPASTNGRDGAEKRRRRDDGEEQDSPKRRRPAEDVRNGAGSGDTSRYRGLYSALHERADDMYKTVAAKLDAVLGELEADLSAAFDARMVAFNSAVQSVVEENTASNGRAVPRVRDNPDTHGFVIVMEKAKPGTFRMATAFVRKEMMKKMKLYRDRNRLMLEFNPESQFNVDRLRKVMRNLNISVTSKNGFTYGGGGLKALYELLRRTLHERDCEVRYAPAEAPTTNSRGASNGNAGAGGDETGNDCDETGNDCEVRCTPAEAPTASNSSRLEDHPAAGDEEETKNVEEQA